jgi:hypothetical protein
MQLPIQTPYIVTYTRESVLFFVEFPDLNTKLQTGCTFSVQTESIGCVFMNIEEHFFIFHLHRRRYRTAFCARCFHLH